MHFKKVLHIGINNAFYSPDGQKEGFERLGMEYSFLDWQKIRFNESIEGLHLRMVTKARMERPDLIFLQLQNSDALDPETAQDLSEIGFVVNFTEDVREDISWYEEIAPYVGLTVFTNIEDVTKLKKKGINNVAFMPTSYNNIWYKRQIPSPMNYGEIVFIGSNYLDTNMNFPKAQERVDMVHFLKEEFGEHFQVYGQGWEDSRLLNPQEAIEAYNNCKVAITHNNFLLPGYTSDRLFNAMGCGAATISQWYPGINKDFNVNVLSTWLNFDMLKEEVTKFIKQPKLRESIANNGYNHVREKHQWANRFDQLINIINGTDK